MADSARWGQLTYSSFDTGSGSGGGWQVKETTGELAADELENLRSRVITNFDAARELPQFPTPEEISELPRRLIYHPLAGHAAAYWHAIPSGVDGTGRPGNVFSHALLDRDFTASTTLRPIDTWRSFWLTPFGQQQVLAAVLGADPSPVAGTIVTRQSVVNFVLDTSVWRGGVFAVLLDAVLHAMRGGKKVVLVTTSVDEAAMWIGAVTHLMAPATARGMGFSVFERVGGVDLAAQRGAVLVAVPIEDLDAALTLENYVVISTDESPSLGDLDGAPHTVRSGATITVTPWSAMAQVALQEPEPAVVVLEKIEQIAARLDTTQLAPEWPLAMAIAVLGGDLVDANDEATRVLHESTPEGLVAIPEYWTAASALIGGLLGTSTSDVWNRVPVDGRRDSVVDDFTVSVYVERALRDRAWMSQPGTVPMRGVLSAQERSGEHLASVAQAAVDALALVASVTPDPALVAFEAARLADFLVRAGLAPAAPSDQNTTSALEVLVERTVIAAIVNDADGSLVSTIGPVSTKFVSDWLLPLLDVDSSVQSRPAGSRLPPIVLDWLSGGRIIELLAPGAVALSPLQVELVVRGCATSDPGARAYRVSAALSLLERDEYHEGAHAFAALFREDWAWAPEEILAVENAFPHSLPTAVIGATLIDSAESPQLAALVALVQRTLGTGHWPLDVEQPAIIRAYCASVNAGVVAVGNSAKSAALAVNWLVSNRGSTAAIPGGDLGTVLPVFLHFLSQGATISLTLDLAKYLATAARRIPNTEPIVSIAEVIARAGSIGPLQCAYLAELVVRGHIESPVPFDALTQRTLATLATQGASSEERFVDLLLEAIIAVESPVPVDELAESVLTSVRSSITVTDFDKQNDRVVSEFERFAKPHWKRLRSLTKTKSRLSLGGVFGSTAQQSTEES